MLFAYGINRFSHDMAHIFQIQVFHSVAMVMFQKPDSPPPPPPPEPEELLEEDDIYDEGLSFKVSIISSPE